MAEPEQDNHDAKKEANGKLDELNDLIDDLGIKDTDRTQLPQGNTDAERLDKLLEELEGILDEVQEAINANQIDVADRKLRQLRRRLLRVIDKKELQDRVRLLLRAARKAKRKITAAPVALQAGDRFFVSLTDLGRSTAEDVAATPLTALRLPFDRARALDALGVRTLDDLLALRRLG